MDLIDLEDDTIDAEVLDSLAVNMDDFRVRLHHITEKRANDTIKPRLHYTRFICFGSLNTNKIGSGYQFLPCHANKLSVV